MGLALGGNTWKHSHGDIQQDTLIPAPAQSEVQQPRASSDAPLTVNRAWDHQTLGESSNYENKKTK